MNPWQQFELLRGQMMILFCFLVRFAVLLNIAQFWRYKSQTYRGPNDILWQLLLGLMPAPKGDCLNDKQIICLVHFYKRCVSGFRCDNICSFLFTGQWRPLYLDSIGCSLHLGVVCPAVGLLWTLANDLCSWIVDRPLLGWVILHSCQK